VFSVTSWSELARNGAAAQAAMLRGERELPTPFVAALLAQSAGPIVAASDYVRAVPESVRAWLPAGRRFLTLGTDGFGRSDTRAALREFFGVSADSIVRAALSTLQEQP
jgi:pyruvate dehydrogenase E1 component